MPTTLYAALGGAHLSSNLYAVDQSTGAMTPVGLIGFAMTGLALDPITNTLYGITSANSSVHPRSLVTVDVATGAGTFIGSEAPGAGTPWTDIAFDSAGNLYALGQGRRLFSVNKATGVGTLIATGGGSTFGGAFSLDSSNLGYAAPAGGDLGSRLYSVTTAGVFTPLAFFTGPLTGGWRLTAFAFDEFDVLWGVDGDNLVTVDVATSAVTVIGPMEFQTDALSFAPGGSPILLPTGIFDGAPAFKQHA